VIRRIVHMRFEAKQIEAFLKIFEESADAIRASEGCHEVVLFQDEDDPTHFTTWSLWTSVEHLNQYRQSDLFKSTWARTKPLFRERAQAFSYTEVG